MNKRELKDFFEWITSGLGASSLALFVFIPTLGKKSSAVEFICLTLFLLCMFTSVAATAISKQNKEKKHKRAELAHTYAITISLVSFMLGLIFLCLHINYLLLISLLVALAATVVLLQFAESKPE
ncbi:hypothetical protein SAMN05216214_1371 [Atopomonas hussainii]|uniref:Uncharacterized protein n=1 Tax=Atopomonas hussainii TaxID=1429083 RepID=A0A1H7TIV2_9GAMM|nr:hypothetical protein SAMN05216214_1371 [Atopomonas hussainii]